MDVPLVNRLNQARDVIYDAFSWYNEAEKHKREYDQAGLKTLHPGLILVVSIAWIIIVPVVIALITQALFKYPKTFTAIGISIVTVFIPWIILKRINNANIEKKREFHRQEYDDNVKRGAMALLVNEDILSVIPERYHYPMAIDYIIQLFNEGRVSDLNDALDRYDTYRHQVVVEVSLAAIYGELQRQTQMLSAMKASIGSVQSSANEIASNTGRIRR